MGSDRRPETVIIMFGVLYAAEGTAHEVLVAIAREFSPRIEICGPREVVLDLGGLARLFGDGRAMADAMRRTAADRAVRVRVAIAGTQTAARLFVRHRAGLTVVQPGSEAAALVPLPLALLGGLANEAAVSSDVHGSSDVMLRFRRWGLRTLGDLAALPPDEIAARLGQSGLAWQHLARGGDPRPLVPAVHEERFEQTLDLEWPIEGLEPLSFVLGRLMEPLAARLERRGRGAAVLHVRLHLIRMSDVASTVHERSLQLPTPIRDARTLRTLVLLDLESHPPPAAVDRVTIAVDPTPGRVLQCSLLTRPLPSPEQVSVLMARLYALMGDTRCGSPAMVNSWQPGAWAMRRFAPRDEGSGLRAQGSRLAQGPGLRDQGSAQDIWSLIPGPRSLPVMALRRFRHPVPVRVHMADGKPASITSARRGVSGGKVDACAGPWRSSGGWWDAGLKAQGSGLRAQKLLIPGPWSLFPTSLHPWDRDEWDVTLAGGPTYRLFRARGEDRWFIDGIVD